MAEEGGEWVLVRATPQKDWWNPSGNAAVEEEEEEEESSRDLKLTFSKPAQEYTEAVPIGNGRLGVMVSGGVPTELLHLNEDTLWTGIPGNYTNKIAPEMLAEVRKLVDKRKYFKATDAAKNMLGLSPDVNYEANGWVAHHVSDIWAKTSPDVDNPIYALWPMGGAWFCTHIWEHYTYTMDELSSAGFNKIILASLDIIN